MCGDGRTGNNLYLVTGHEGYVDAGVGQGHQGYLMVQIDKTTLKGSIVDCNLGHSFAQYIKSDGAQLYVLEQSEGGRCTELSKYDTASMKKQSLSVLEYGGFRTDAWQLPVMRVWMIWQYPPQMFSVSEHPSIRASMTNVTSDSRTTCI